MKMEIFLGLEMKVLQLIHPTSRHRVVGEIIGYSRLRRVEFRDNRSGSVRVCLQTFFPALRNSIKDASRNLDTPTRLSYIASIKTPHNASHPEAEGQDDELSDCRSCSLILCSSTTKSKIARVTVRAT